MIFLKRLKEIREEVNYKTNLMQFHKVFKTLYEAAACLNNLLRMN